jgi:hypothetical protein
MCAARSALSTSLLRAKSASLLATRGIFSMRTVPWSGSTIQSQRKWPPHAQCVDKLSMKQLSKYLNTGESRELNSPPKPRKKPWSKKKMSSTTCLEESVIQSQNFMPHSNLDRLMFKPLLQFTLEEVKKTRRLKIMKMLTFKCPREYDQMLCPQEWDKETLHQLMDQEIQEEANQVE